MMYSVRQILDRKSDKRVACVDVEATVQDAAKCMNDRRIGAVVVTENERVVGIFTERDILCRVVAERIDPAKKRIREVMSSPVASCAPDTKVSECRSVMRAKRIRHLPVVQSDELVGIISIGDILEDENSEHAQTIRYMHGYLHGDITYEQAGI
jgi:CBS domain-containing protein